MILWFDFFPLNDMEPQNPIFFLSIQYEWR